MPRRLSHRRGGKLSIWSSRILNLGKDYLKDCVADGFQRSTCCSIRLKTNILPVQRREDPGRTQGGRGY